MATVTRDRSALGGRIEARSSRDRSLLRSVLERDRLFAAYALADTDDAEFGRTRWGVAFEAGEPIALAMEYRGLSPQPLFAMGDPSGIRTVLRDVVRPRISYASIRRASVPALRDHYRVDAPAPMVRMVVERETFQPVVGEAVRLDQGDTRHLNRLYQLGFSAHLPEEAVATGVYFGVRRGTRLIAAAGTHVISRQLGIAAVGNVYTHREYRGQGLAKVVTSAVTAELLRECDTVVLNVRTDNPPARAVYRALGYRDATEYEERLIHRQTSLWDSIVGPVRAFVSELRRNE
ncbi:MAG: GNAT family N-acetyltransferase [Chloroflexota bacterium]|jgi:RimJ/RimL family protein N-acetyltransferase